MATSIIKTHTGTLVTPTVPGYVELLQNKSMVYPSGQKLIQVQLHFTQSVPTNWTILGLPSALQTNAYVGITVIYTNSGEVYGANINGNVVSLKKAAPAGWYVLSVMYE